jgi:hypothetical protein
MMSLAQPYASSSPVIIHHAKINHRRGKPTTQPTPLGRIGASPNAKLTPHSRPRVPKNIDAAIVEELLKAQMKMIPQYTVRRDKDSEVL